jgi:hypothetical protein
MQQRSVREHLVQALLGIVVVAAGATVGALYAESRPSAQDQTSFTSRTKADLRLTRLIARNGCWTRQAPADMVGQVPGHVVVTHRGRLRYSERLVTKALEQAFASPDPDWVVHAFCR